MRYSFSSQGQTDNLLVNYFSWAGSKFPFDNGAGNVTISSPTTWGDVNGFKRVGKLTINAGQTLTIARSPFVIFAREINFGNAASCIDGSGPSGAASGTYSQKVARGGLVTHSANGRAQGGCGGISLIVVAGSVGGASGIIKANGGDGFAEDTNPSTSESGYTKTGAQGALSNLAGPIYNVSQRWLVGDFANPPGLWLVRGGGAAYDAYDGGGLGGGSSGTLGGGDSLSYGAGGFGGGGGVNVSQSALHGAANNFSSLTQVLHTILNYQCLGGGGGAAYLGPNTRAAGGGGGGAAIVFAKNFIVTPVLQANGGLGVGAYGGNGGAGVTFLIQV